MGSVPPVEGRGGTAGENQVALVWGRAAVGMAFSCLNLQVRLPKDLFDAAISSGNESLARRNNSPTAKGGAARGGGGQGGR